MARTLFAIVGRFSGHGYEDIRVTKEQFEELRENGDFATNLNRLPILNHNHFEVGQSSAINQYLAKQFGLMGVDATEAAQIQAMVAHVDDLKAAYRKLGKYWAPVNPFSHSHVALLAVLQLNQPVSALARTRDFVCSAIWNGNDGRAGGHLVQHTCRACT